MNKSDKSKPRLFSNLRRTFKAIVIQVTEGNGSAEHPFETAQYAMDEDGKILGKIISEEWISLYGN